MAKNTKNTNAVLRRQMDDMRRDFENKITEVELESSRNRTISLRESQNSWSQIAFDLGMDLNIGGTKYTKQGLIETSGPTQQITQDELYECWDKNAIGAAIVDYYSIYPLGEGPMWNIPWDEVDQVVKDFWLDNDLDNKIYKWASEISLNGEHYLRLFADKIGDNMVEVKVRSLDPSTIVRVITDPEDADSPLYYHQRYFAQVPPDTLLPPDGSYPTADWVSSQDGYKNVINFEPVDANGSPIQGEVAGFPGGQFKYDPQVGFFAFITRQIDAREVIHTKISALDWETRGRSDLYRVVRWIREYVAVLQALSQLSKMATIYLYDVEVEGGEKSVQSVIQANMQPPPPGSIKVHSNMEKWNIITPEINSQDHQATISSILSMISTGTKLAPFMLGVSGDATFSGANTQFLPVVKMFRLRQRVLIHLFRELFKRVIKIHQFYGTLPKSVEQYGPDGQPNGKTIDPSRYDFNLRLPEVAEIDLLEKATAVGTLIQNEIASLQTAQEMLGLNPKEQQAELEDESNRKLEKQIDSQRQMMDAGVMPDPSKPDPQSPTPSKQNIVKQKNNSKPKVGPAAGGDGKPYPNHQRSTTPRRPG